MRGGTTQRTPSRPTLRPTPRKDGEREKRRQVKDSLMKLTLSWLKDHLETDKPVEELAAKLNAIGLEVESIEDPGAKLGAFTLANYKVWLGSWDLLPILFNSVVYSTARLAIGLFFALLFAWAAARTNVPYAGLMAWMIPIP